MKLRKSVEPPQDYAQGIHKRGDYEQHDEPTTSEENYEYNYSDNTPQPATQLNSSRSSHTFP